MHVLTDRQEIQAAEELLRAQFKERAERRASVQVGYQGGSVKADVYWHGPLGIWGSINAAPLGGSNGKDRFWNAFGTEDPGEKSSLSIVCEVNPSHEGASFRVGGLFARGHDGKTYLLHSGRIGGGRAGVGQKLFWEHWPYRKTSVVCGKSAADCAVVAELESPQAMFEIARFVKEVQRIKSLAPAT
jgi:hypothetical protein